MSFNISVVGGSSVRLPTKGKYCDRDIVITAMADTELFDSLLTGSMTELNSDVTTVRQNAFHNCKNLVRVNLPKATEIGSSAFYNCTKLESFNAPNILYLEAYCLYSCSSLVEIVLPKVTLISASACQNCTALKKVDCTSVKTIGTKAFQNCLAMEAIILRKTDAICTLNTDAFLGSSVENGTGYIYVPASLVDSYKTDSSWSTYANQIRAIEDYPEITGG